MTATPDARWLRRPIRIELPGTRRQHAPSTPIVFGWAPWSRAAGVLAIAIPVAMMGVGIVTAIVAADRAERPATEGLGTLGVELGAVLWFSGAVALGARRAPTVLRIVLLVLTGLAGAALIAIALTRDWTGAGLSLAMEFGVGAVAVSVIDVVLLGLIGGFDQLARTPANSVVAISIGASWHLVDVRIVPGAQADGMLHTTGLDPT